LLSCKLLAKTGNKASVALIGPGKLAQSLAPALAAARYRVREIVGRDSAESRRRTRALARRVGAAASTLTTATFDADLVWLCVSDDAIGACAREIAPLRNWKGKLVLHSSGALSSDLLAPLSRRGAHVGTLHPMMSFVHGSATSMRGVPFAVEGSAAALRVARRIARDLGGFAFEIKKKNKTLYHSAGSFASPMLVVVLATAEKIARTAGVPAREVRRVLAPILRKTIENYIANGAAAAFSGPLVRGDVRTIERHVRELRRVPGALEAYRALVGIAVRELPVRRAQDIRKIVGSRR